MIDHVRNIVALPQYTLAGQLKISDLSDYPNECATSLRLSGVRYWGENVRPPTGRIGCQIARNLIIPLCSVATLLCTETGFVGVPESPFQVYMHIIPREPGLAWSASERSPLPHIPSALLHR